MYQMRFSPPVSCYPQVSVERCAKKRSTYHTTIYSSRKSSKFSHHILLPTKRCQHPYARAVRESYTKLQQKLQILSPQKRHLRPPRKVPERLGRAVIFSKRTDFLRVSVEIYVVRRAVKPVTNQRALPQILVKFVTHQEVPLPTSSTELSVRDAFFEHARS